ncbi:hypothetical protein AB0N89_34500 [Amycolatopsis sp. NPDC089917]|uniref:hypothetical protein n=1 Tax=Amycolatopsis sp. NPDC089917 TaxID=3155187 RepID=UPI00341B2CF1
MRHRESSSPRTRSANVYLAFESGAHYYSKASDKPGNIISNLRKAPLSSLEELAPR